MITPLIIRPGTAARRRLPSELYFSPLIDPHGGDQHGLVKPGSPTLQTKEHISQPFLQIGATMSLRSDQSHVASPGNPPRQHPVCLGGAKR